MSVKVYIPCNMEHLTNKTPVVEVEGVTVGGCLQHLVKQYPGIKKEIFTKDGKLNTTVEVFVNAESAFPLELLKPVKDGDEVYISGGAM